MLTLDVAISTCNPDGIKRVEKMLQAPQTGVKYVISWQDHENTPIPQSLLEREDVSVFRLDIKGLSNNRNNSIANCKSDIVLMADDDLEYESDFANKIKNKFIANPDVDLAIFKIDFPYEKKYPDKDCQLSFPLPKNYYCSSVEIAFRREKLQSLKFWEKMGLGNEYLKCGEDELFFISAMKRGFKCMFFNQLIATHPNISTGYKIDKGILRGQGFIMGLIYPGSILIRLPLKAFRLSKTKKIAFFPTLFKLSSGAFNSIFNLKKIPKSSRW